MSPDFRTYLATEILSEQRTISYRNVARALKCHVNAAKRMLYEYYEEQKKKKKGCVYAMYMLAGTKRSPEPVQEVNGDTKVNGHNDEEGDEPMTLPSSPPPFTSSMMEPSQHSAQQDGVEAQHVPVKTIMLVREEDVEATKAQFEEITSIHIYSLSPGKIPDLVALTDIGRGLYADVFSKEDPLQHNKTYGVILNKDVRRRKGKRPNLPPAVQPKMIPVKEEKGKPAAAAPAATKAITAAQKPTSTLKKEGTTSRPSSRDSTSTRDEKAPTLKRDASDIFKAFAKSSQKSKTKPKEEVKDDSQDTKMTDADEEGESEDEALFLDTNTRTLGTKRMSDVKQDRADKTAKLRKMMDSDDEAEVEPVEKEAELPQDEPAEKNDVTKEEGNEDVAWSDSDGEGTKRPAQKQEEPAGPRRKRGKRKAIKKRTMKDEDGFLVTKEEEVWEEFSETDNEEPKKEVKKAFPSKSSAPSSQTQGSQKSKGGAKKGGGSGGSIMSFFGKK